MRKALLLVLAMILLFLSGCDNGDTAKTEVAKEPEKKATDTIEPTKSNKLTIGVLYLDFYGEAPAPLKQVWIESDTKIIIDEINSEGYFLGSGEGVMTCEDNSTMGLCKIVTTYKTEWDVAGEFDADTCQVIFWPIGYWVEGKQCTKCEMVGEVCEPLPEVEWDLDDVVMHFLYESETIFLTKNNVKWEYEFKFEKFEESLMPKEFIKECDLFVEESE